MNSPTISLDEFKRLAMIELQAKIEAERNIQYEITSPDWLAVIALVPEWTLPLADRAFGTTLTSTLLNLAEANKLEVIQSPLMEEQTPEQIIYRLPAQAREQVLAETIFNPSIMVELSAVLAERLNQLHFSITDESSVTPATYRWSALARHLHFNSQGGISATEPLIDEFEQRINLAVDEKNSSELLHWIDAARPLAEILQRNSDLQLVLALHRAGRRLELFRREENDRRHLRSYLSRDEQEQAFEELMNDSDEFWALHYIGVGGVGKTMLLRHIQTNLAPQYRAVTARVDFDFLSPDYPRLSPGLLLWAFAQELMLYDSTGRATELFNRANKKLRRLHDELRLDRARYEELRPTQHPLFREALEIYIEAFEQISPRIILILDTCEELEKVKAGNQAAENVEETFRILRALHDGPDSLWLDDEETPQPEVSYRPSALSDMRVIFSGRRPLANKGAGWRSNNQHLRERHYLRLHEIRGFTMREAHTFLTVINQSPSVPSDLVSAIIEKSKPTSRVPALQFDSDPAALNNLSSQSDNERCNPYELKLYADWAKEVPPPSAETILNASQAKYVELRIIQRLHDRRVEKLLPAVAVLGHFDQPTLRICSDLNDEDFAEAFDRLLLEEWIAQRIITDGQQTQVVCDVEPKMRMRLEAYFAERGFNSQTIRIRAADHLEQFTLQGDMQVFDWTTFDSAIRALMASPERALKWWEQLEDRMFTYRDAKWVLDVTGTLQGSEGVVSLQADNQNATQREVQMRTLVLITHATALMQSGAYSEARSYWEAVLDKADSLSDPDLIGLFRLRALAGTIASFRTNPQAMGMNLVGELWSTVNEVETRLTYDYCSMIGAAAEVLIELSEQLQATDSDKAQECLKTGLSDADKIYGLRWLVMLTERAAASITEPTEQQRLLLAFINSLAARAEILLSNYDKAERLFAKARELSESIETNQAAIVWKHWMPPQDVAARIRLEYARAVCPAIKSASEVLNDIMNWSVAPEKSVDSDRLHALIIQLNYAIRLVPADAFSEGWTLETYNQDILFRQKIKSSLPETCNAHRLVPPLFAVMCEALAAKGEVNLPLQRLGNISSDASLFLTDTVRHAERSHSRIVRKMKLQDQGLGRYKSLYESILLSDRELVWELEGLNGNRNQEPIPTIPDWIKTEHEIKAALHASWRTRYISNKDEALGALKWAEQNLVRYYVDVLGPDDDFLQISLNLDLIEAGKIARNFGLIDVFPDLVPSVFEARQWAEKHSHNPEAVARLWIRSKALQLKGTMYVNDPVCLSRLGARKLANIGLAEKELLALRLPNEVDFSPEKIAFTLAEDFVSATIAGVLSSIYAAKPIGDLRAEYENILQAPTNLFSMQQALPPWIEINDYAQNLRTEALADSAPFGWYPMLARIAYCLVKENVTGNETPVLAQKTSVDTMKRKYESAFGLRSEAGILFSPDWIHLFKSDTQTAGQKLSLPRGTLKKTFLGLVGIAIFAGIVGVTYWVFSFISSTFFATGVSHSGVGSFLLFTFYLAFSFVSVARMRQELKSTSDSLARYCVIAVYLSLICISLPAILLALGLEASYGSEWKYGTHILDVIIVLVLFSSLFIAPKSIELIRSWIASVFRLTLDITQINTDNKIALRLSRLTSELSLVGTESVGLVQHVYPEVEWDLPEAKAYQHYAQSFPTRLGLLLKARAFDANPRLREVVIRLDSPSHGTCWESMIAYNLRGEMALPENLNLSCRRTVRSQRTPANTQLKSATHLMLSTDAWLGIPQAWGELEAKAGIHTILPGTYDDAMPVNGSNTIVHFIGDVEETSAGLRFRLDGLKSRGEDVRLDTKWQSSMESIITESPAGYYEGTPMLQADDIVKLYAATSLCILQGTPRSHNEKRLDSDRRDAQRLRIFAGELHSMGIAAVLVLPSMPNNLAIEIISRIANVIATRPSVAGQKLLQCIADIRTEIAASTTLEKETSWELAYDICLYCTDDWYGINRWAQKALSKAKNQPVEF